MLYDARSSLGSADTHDANPATDGKLTYSVVIGTASTEGDAPAPTAPNAASVCVLIDEIVRG
eukprot:scaffold132491_cov31-Tisochrysis_lutea.AAC.7